MTEGIDTVVLHNELAFHGEYQLEWVPLPAPPDAHTLESLDAANTALLQACIASEEQPVRDKNDEFTPLANELARLDYKINLALQMLATLSARHAPPMQSRPVRFNAVGATWTAVAPLPAVGDYGTLRIRLQSTLPQCLEMAARVAEVDAAEVSLSYLRLSEACGEQLQRLCFLRHRKQVAGARKSRPL
jgi:hypothetical protein